jgi:hypothetical protein
LVLPKIDLREWMNRLKTWAYKETVFCNITSLDKDWPLLLVATTK